MRRALCLEIPKVAGKAVELPEGEARHLISVLRLKPGDEIELLDGNGFRSRGTLFYKGKTLFAETTGTPETEKSLMARPVHLAMALIKGEAMEWTIEKAVELGVASLTPVEMEFSVVKTGKKGEDAFRDRYQKIADQTLKQCGRLERLHIHAPVSFEQMLMKPAARIFWLDESLAKNAEDGAHLASQLKHSDPAEVFPAQLLVGPEGGFSPAEKERLLRLSQLTSPPNKAIKRVHLGSIILRAETAALFGTALLVGHHDGK